LSANNCPFPDSTDLVVIGGGMCGVSTARHAAEAGKQVVLLEAATVGSGMTGMSAGHVMTGFLPSPAEMIAMLGAAETLRLQRWSHESKLALRRRWIDLGLEDSVTDEYLLVARTRDERDMLQGIAAYWSEQLGIGGVSVLAGSELVKYICSPLIDSALYDPSAFSIDPPTLVEGLQRLVCHQGIDVFEQTTVLRLASEGGRHRIETTRGTLVVDRIAVCTGASSLDFVAEVKSPMNPEPTLFALTEPIVRDTLRAILPSCHTMPRWSRFPMRSPSRVASISLRSSSVRVGSNSQTLNRLGFAGTSVDSLRHSARLVRDLSYA
jgi:gamma-glutamylputrescine oxidase